MSSRCDRLRGAVTVSEVRPDQTNAASIWSLNLSLCAAEGSVFFLQSGAPSLDFSAHANET